VWGLGTSAGIGAQRLREHNKAEVTRKDWWSYSNNPIRILFGIGSLSELGCLVESFSHLLLVTTPSLTKLGVTERVCSIMGTGRTMVVDDIQPNPDLVDFENRMQVLASEPIQAIVGLGGGSVLDTAKVLSFLWRAGSSDVLRAHFERGAELPSVGPLPVIAIPTTAGTGSEVTPFATVWDKQRIKKYSLTFPNLSPNVALLDPQLTLSLPENMTVATGLDALSQGLEAIWNRNANSITMAYALQAVVIAFRTLLRLVNALDDLEYRSRMLEASLLSGLAIRRTRTALAHAISYPVTAVYGVPHGLACGFTLPAILEFNAQVDDGRLVNLARQLGFESIQSFRDELVAFLGRLDVRRRLEEYFSSTDQLLELAPRMLTPGRADNNLRAVEVSDVRAILRAAWVGG